MTQPDPSPADTSAPTSFPVPEILPAEVLPVLGFTTPSAPTSTLSAVRRKARTPSPADSRPRKRKKSARRIPWHASPLLLDAILPFLRTTLNRLSATRGGFTSRADLHQALEEAFAAAIPAETVRVWLQALNLDALFSAPRRIHLAATASFQLPDDRPALQVLHDPDAEPQEGVSALPTLDPEMLGLPPASGGAAGGQPEQCVLPTYIHDHGA